ncbi:MAG TPA: Hpt domain-containing protein [Candidatus Atribacteria bacterium]|nr:Hpt domain-containing protein [Candidatus Atribacteria bacterium]
MIYKRNYIELLLKIIRVSQRSKQEMGPTLNNIESALESADYDQLRHVAHGMKGASSNLGADKISVYFKQLEQMGLDKSVDGAKEILVKIKQAHTELLDVLKTI